MPDPGLSVYFPQLPIEIAEAIAKLSARASSPHGLTYLSRVCKTFHNWVIPILYESIFLSNAHQISLFAATIEETPRLRPLVIKLYIFLAEYQAPVTKKPFKRYIEDSDISESNDDGSTFLSDGNSASEEDEAIITEDLTLAAEAVPEDSDDEGPVGAYTRFTPRAVPAPCYEFAFTPAALSTTWRPTGPRLSLAANLFRSVIYDTSLVDAYSSTILKHCAHTRTLLSLTSYSGSLMVGGIADLTLHMAPLDLRDPIQLQTNDYSSLTHLTLFGPHCPIPCHIPERAPNITHLQIRRDTCVATRDTLSNMQHLTHLWLTPDHRTQLGHRPLFTFSQMPLPEFLRDLHQKCLVLVRVRIDVGPDENVQDIDSGLFPLVGVHRYAHVDPSWSSHDPWVNAPNVCGTRGNPNNSGESELDMDLPSDVEMNSDSDSNSDINLKKTIPMFNVYTARVEEYWMHRLHGGGWDD